MKRREMKETDFRDLTACAGAERDFSGELLRDM